VREMLDKRKEKDRMMGRRRAENLSCLSQGQLAEAAGVLCDLMAVPADYVHQILANIYEVGILCRLRMKDISLISSLRVRSILLVGETPRGRKIRASICGGQVDFRWTDQPLHLTTELCTRLHALQKAHLGPPSSERNQDPGGRPGSKTDVPGESPERQHVGLWSAQPILCQKRG
jgi:hypothetical protein